MRGEEIAGLGAALIRLGCHFYDILSWIAVSNSCGCMTAADIHVTIWMRNKAGSEANRRAGGRLFAGQRGKNMDREKAVEASSVLPHACIHTDLLPPPELASRQTRMQEARRQACVHCSCSDQWASSDPARRSRGGSGSTREHAEACVTVGAMAASIHAVTRAGATSWILLV